MTGNSRDSHHIQTESRRQPSRDKDLQSTVQQEDGIIHIQTFRTRSIPTLMLPLLSHQIHQRVDMQRLGGREGGPSPSPETEQHLVPRHKFLTPSEWSTFAQGIGGSKDPESQSPTRPNAHTWWPARGMPCGLYRDVVTQRSKCFYLFHVSSILRWALIILQIIVGAAITALGPFAKHNSLPITILGAANTVIAGLVAILHNSGIPDRFRNDMIEFEKVEDHIREILEGRLAPADQELDQILAECFDMFTKAKCTVTLNLPGTYKTPQGQDNKNRSSGGDGKKREASGAGLLSEGKSFMQS